MQKIYICRHGETKWSKSGQHTSFTDLSLTQNGKAEGTALGKRLSTFSFVKVLISPLKRARETAALANLHGDIEDDLVEWNYGEYEGLTTQEIHKKAPDWNIFTHGAPKGETPKQIEARALRVLAKVQKIQGDVCLVSSGHISRAIASMWLSGSVSLGRNLVLSPASLSCLGFEHQNRALLFWNDTSHIVLNS